MHEDMTTEALATLVESIAGADPMRCNRSRPVVEARIILTQALLTQGLTEEAVAEKLGFNRSTINYYRERMRDAQKYGNAPEMLANWYKLKSLLDL
jgi:transposase